MRACVACYLGFECILNGFCNKTVMLAKIFIRFINKLKKGLFWWCNNYLIVE